MSAKDLFAALLSIDNNVRTEAEVRIFIFLIFSITGLCFSEQVTILSKTFERKFSLLESIALYINLSNFLMEC